MRANQASRTAMVVACLRAMGELGLTSVPGFHDAQARELLTGTVWKLILRRAASLARKPGSYEARYVTQQVDGMILRVSFIDLHVAEAHAPQVVILGAGLDTRAWRLDTLRGATVFEVDHPATQAYKREHAARLGPAKAELRFVPVDFARESLAPALAAAGHDPTRPTMWIWEGVIMYLDDEALRSTLSAVRTLSAPGSRLAAHYHTESQIPFARLARALIFGWIGEAQVGIRSREAMHAELARAGFGVLEDAGVVEQAARVGAPRGAGAVYRVSRIAVVA